MYDSEFYITVVILLAALVFSTIGNLLVIISALINRELRNNTGLLIMNLAVSDLCISSFSLPLRLLQMLGFNWSDGFTSCGITVGFTVFFFTASNFNLFLVTLDRFLGVLWPVKYRIRNSKRKIGIAICTSWILACLIAFFPKFAVGEQKNENVSKLNFICTFGTVIHPSYLIFMEAFTLFLPWSLMILMYSAILRTVFNSTKRPVPQASHSKIQTSRFGRIVKTSRRKKEVKLAKGIFIIIIIYSILMVPIAVIDLLQLIGRLNVPLTAIRVTVLMAYLNPAVNPPVYAATIKKYRDTFSRIFTCRLIINARSVFSSKVISLSDQPSKRNKIKRNKLAKQSSDGNDTSEISDALFSKPISTQLNEKENKLKRMTIVPIFTITEEMETPFIQPLPIHLSSCNEDLSD